MREFPLGLVRLFPIEFRVQFGNRPAPVPFPISHERLIPQASYPQTRFR